MRVFNWYLVNSFEEGKAPVCDGTITGETEESAKEFIVRMFDDDLFDQYKSGEYVLVLKEMGSW